MLSQDGGFDIFVDFPGYKNSSKVFHDAVQPDLLSKRNHRIVALELTCCFETKMLH